MTFSLYLIGYILFVAGLAWGAFRFGVSPTWIAVGVVVMLGLGIFTGATATRRKDPSLP